MRPPARRPSASPAGRIRALSALLALAAAPVAARGEEGGAPAPAPAPAPTPAPAPAPAAAPAPAPAPAPSDLPAGRAALPHDYPREARAELVSGVVRLELRVAPDGGVVHTVVTAGVRPDLDADARRTAATLRFPPGGPELRPHAVVYVLGLTEPIGGARAALRLTVLGPDGAPRPGAAVTLTPVDAADGEPRALVADEAGRVRAFLPSGTWRVALGAPGLGPGELVVSLGRGRAHTLSVPLADAPSTVRVGVPWAWSEGPDSSLARSLAPASTVRLARRALTSAPGSGEDGLRALTAVPGLSADTAGPATFSVRGADPDALLVLYEGVPVPGPRSVAGLDGLVDPDLVAEVALTPSAPDAATPATAGGVLAVEAWRGPDDRDGRRRDVDGSVALSFHEARVAVAGSVPRAPALTFSLSARRSYDGVYAWGLERSGLLDAPRATPEHDAVTAHLEWSFGRQGLGLSLLRTTGRLDAPADAERLVPRLGAFTLTDALHLATLSHALVLPDFELRSLVSVARADRGLATGETAAVTQGFARSDALFPAWERHTMRVGVLGQLRDTTGSVPDPSVLALPTWAAAPQGTTSATSSGSDRRDSQVAAYAEHGWDGFLTSRVGVRATWLLETGEVLPSPTAGVAVPLPTGTSVRLLGGLYHHVVDDPALLSDADDPPRAERAWQLVLGVDQGLPVGDRTVVRVEGHVAALDSLAVFGDPATLDPADPVQNVGTGRNLGLDLTVSSTLGRLDVDGHLSLLRATRTNPLNSAFPDDVVPGHAEAASGSFRVAWQASPAVRLAARYVHRAGRPVSSVEPDGADGLALAALNDQRLGDLRTLDVRAEWARATTRLRYSVYVDVLNVLNLPDPLLRTASLVDGEVRLGAVEQLPIRPSLGFQADF